MSGVREVGEEYKCTHLLEPKLCIRSHIHPFVLAYLHMDGHCLSGHWARGAGERENEVCQRSGEQKMKKDQKLHGGTSCPLR